MRLNILEKRAAGEIISICKTASRRGLLDGWSGNASCRLGGQRVMITASGKAKGLLSERDCIVLDMEGQILNGAGKPSSEYPLHLALYREIAECAAILHTHPVNLQALELGRKENLAKTLCAMELFEAGIWGAKLFVAEPLPPGTVELGRSAIAAISRPVSLPCAIWLPRHGLAALAKNLRDALCLSEELEHLAAVQLKYMAAGGSAAQGR